jgi:LPPG:FO 2-phospho-L-lactate transferase
MKVVALAGGVGGAKLVYGLANVLDPEDLTVVVNTGDDFDHLGLRICPDLDTVCYNLAGIASPEPGWGRAEETWNAMESLERLGAPTWFQLGDRDLGTHLERTRLLKEGAPLSQITRRFCQAWGVRPAVIPMSDDPVSTLVHTDEGDLPFQEYFVHRRCEPRVSGFHFEGREKACPAPGLLEGLDRASLIVICPSNPWVSIDPILGLPGVREALRSGPANGKRVIAVSPIIGGEAVKGPAAKMYAELGYQPSALAVAEHYGAAHDNGLLAGLVLDRVDSWLAQDIQALGVATYLSDTYMQTSADKDRLAEEVIEFGKTTLKRLE